MYATIIVGIIAIILAYLNGNKSNDKYLKVDFVILTIFLSLGYNWGPDVPSYHESFKEINSFRLSIFDFEALTNIRRQGEVGWSILNILAYPIGFYGFRFVLFSLENVILFRLVKECVDKKWQWLALFIYVFNAPELMVISSPMMRQWLAMCLVVASFLLYKHGYWKSAIIIFCITPTIHASAFISIFLIPLLFVKNDLTKNKKILTVVVFVIYANYGADLLAPYLALLLAGDFDFYEVYLEASSGQGSGIVAILRMLIFLALFISINSVEKKDRFFIAAVFCSVLFLPLQSFGQLIVRLSYYYSIFSIVALPQFFAQTRWKPVFKHGALVFLMLFYLYGFWIHFTGPIFRETMYEYHTIFEASEWT